MSELHCVFSPVFPVDKDVDVAQDAEPLAHTSSIQVFVQLAEPVVFIQGFHSSQQNDRPPSILRGSLVLRVLKPTKLKSVSLSFKGFSRTEWPEGIPPKRQDFVEINDIVNHTWPFYQAHNRNSYDQSARKSSSDGNLDADHAHLLHESGASLYKTLSQTASRKNKRQSVSSTNGISSLSLASNGGGDNRSITDAASGSGRSLSPMFLLRRATSPGPKADDHRTHRSSTTTSLISDLLSGTFSTPADTTSSNSSNSDNHHGNDHGNASGSGSEQFIFQPGEYIYTFEQAIPSSYPESVKADFGFVEYQLFVSIERFGAFKSNLTARLPVTLVRAQADTSVEETEPIAISRDWESQLHYDIVIASKDIILDAFLPIAFHFSPMDKVTLHRIRVYLTETMEYYCRNKKVHRMEPTKKFLLAEHDGPRLPGTSDSGALKAKNMGNLLLDEKSGDLVNKNFEYQVFVPSVLSNNQRLHPDTAFDNIKANHWIKLCLRLSKMVDGKRKHYEISIDSPIHVLHKLCSHANTLLPSYDSHITTNEQALSSCPKFGNTSDVNIYHDSNIFFPKEVLQSPMLSPEVHPLDLNLEQRSMTASPRSRRVRRDTRTEDTSMLLSPSFKANIYQPDQIQRELTSPQALPLSPMTSPPMRPLHPSEAPPAFESEVYSLPTLNNSGEMPRDPPSYGDVLKADGVESTYRSPNSVNQSIPKITFGRSEETLDGKHQPSTVASVTSAKKSVDIHPRSNMKTAEDDDDDITSGFSFQGVSQASPNLPSAVLKSPAVKPLNLNVDVKRERAMSLTDNLPSTVRNASSSFNDMSAVLAGGNENSEESGLSRVATNCSKSSSFGKSPRSSMDSNTSFTNRTNMEPLLHHTETQRNVSVDDIVFQSRDSINNYANIPVDSSIDITALYDRNSNAWHPLQAGVDNALSPAVSPRNSIAVANSNQVLDDFKNALRDDNDLGNDGREDSVSTLRQSGETSGESSSGRTADSIQEPPRRPESGDKQLINHTDRETTYQSIDGGLN